MKFGKIRILAIDIRLVPSNVYQHGISDGNSNVIYAYHHNLNMRGATNELSCG